MNTNSVVINKTSTGYNVEVTFANGFTESIEGLYDLDTALDYGRMHLSSQSNKYA